MKLIIIFCYLGTMLHSSSQKNLQETIMWYSLLEDVYNMFSSYTFQQNPTKFNVADLHDWGQQNKPQGLEINQYNLDHFLHLVNLHHFSARRDTHTFTNITETSPDLHVLNRILNETLRKKPTTTFSNDTLKQVEGTFVKISDLPKLLIGSQKDEEMQMIQVFAADTIFIDQDLKVYNAHLALLAPKISVEGTRKIHLLGLATTKTKSRAANGVNAGEKGRDGEPGEPGQPSGHVIIIARDYQNTKNLTVISEGGRGGQGQDGGHGADGIDDSGPGCDINLEWCTGGNGGDGGAGGLGGEPGYVRALYIGKNLYSKIHFISKNGQIGTGGKGGNGGKGGKKGEVTKNVGGKEVSEFEFYESGHPGNSGKNEKNRQPPKQPTPMDPHLRNVVSDCKVFLMKNLKNPIIESNVFNFLREIGLDERLEQSYRNSPEFMINDFINLEKQYTSINNTANLLTLYEDYLQRIENQSRFVDLKNKETAKIWTFLYAAIQTKVCALERLENGKFISNFADFLKLFSKNVELLGKIDKEAVVVNLKNNYKDDLDQQIKESNDIITTHVVPEIKLQTTENDGSLQSLVNEIKSLESSAKQNETLMALRQGKLLLLVLKSQLSYTLQFMGNGLQITSTLSKALTAFEDQGETVGNEGHFQEVQDAVSERAKKKADNLKDQLQIILSLTKDKSSSFKHASDMTNAIIKDMDSFDVFKDVKKEFMKRMKQAIQELEKSYVNPEKTVKILDNIMRGAKFNLPPFRTLKTIGLEEVVKLVGINKRDMERINKFEEQLDEKMHSLLIIVKELIGNNGQNLKKYLKANLEKINRYIRDYLNTITTVLEDILLSFGTVPDINKPVQKIKVSLSALGSIYEGIKKYQSSKQMADLVSDLSSHRYEKIKFEDPATQKAMDELELALQTDLVLLEYSKSLHLLKLFVFPLAKLYLRNFDLHVILQNAKDKNTILQNAIKQVDMFRKKLAESEVFLTKYDKIKYQAGFYHDSSNGPFFVWKNEEYQDSISDLFAGKTVFFEARVGTHDKNAIKFNKIYLRFSSLKDQSNIAEILEEFHVVMTHTGHNYYKCNNKTYVITTEPQELKFGLVKSHGDFIDKNVVYEKLENSDYMLSPFTTWKIQLLNTTKGGYDVLANFEESVDLQLVGEGEYFEKDSDVCGDDLDDFYVLANATQKAEKECLEAVTGFQKNKEACINLHVEHN